MTPKCSCFNIYTTDGFFLDNYTSNKAFRIAKPLKAGVRIAGRLDVSVTKLLYLLAVTIATCLTETVSIIYTFRNM